MSVAVVALILNKFCVGNKSGKIRGIQVELEGGPPFSASQARLNRS